MKTIRFGIIGGGMMGKEFASAAARWCHLTEVSGKPEIVALCDTNESIYGWYQDNFPSITRYTSDYHDLLNDESIDAIYCAVPHHLHEQLYIDIIEAGKHLFAEKPFGIDKSASEKILACIESHPDVFVRCTSEFPFYPAMQALIRELKPSSDNTLLYADIGFLHSSDINPDKPINWKRQQQFCGEYGCMGDLGMHILHVPLKLGWAFNSVYAQLSDVVQKRKNTQGEWVDCDTYENADLHCQARWENQSFPVRLKTYRIAPGHNNSWYFELHGTKRSYRFSTANPNQYQKMEYEAGGKQIWQTVPVGYLPAYSTISGGIMEFGFTDAVQQMWASFVDELATGSVSGFQCVTPQEAFIQHQIFTAALLSHQNQSVEEIQ
ncbi:putative dehydrogenase [Vibrio nigripulchritudo SO65]|uniref:Gfo/Idh/MocA family protein n=1 Tax=Vibrio nigripulchritudo TaxID=28173 RepID=UPI0003B23F2C|nr:Gfo/Idh/MocA family oxidoreductase [Vibrio nigripulchritudo]CCN33478.1 putative dehydrogenase [Vibrio nigripulchritudo AM115]CCN41488.1 putative dehydrogenase [Vibrio nigripulchritudo FTn2]CCN64165.1 putative dehydrogenase [Vibrio nigripulchritudo POn4]CCN75769.1 putative dehydrogenase [Vibrio nigripulchritudo SO65]